MMDNESANTNPSASGVPQGHQGHSHSPAVVEVDYNSTKKEPAEDELLEQMEGLMATLEAERNSVKELTEKNKKLKKRLTAANKIFQGDWKNTLRKWKREEKVKRKVARLEGTVETLKAALAQEASKMGDKLEEVEKLTAKLSELKSGEVKETVVATLPKIEMVAELAVEERNPGAAIFSNKMWKLVFGKLSDPKDLWNLCNTCPFFDVILSQWKTGWLLEQALPYLYQYLPSNKLLECRLICRSWKSSVDQFLDEHPSMQPHNPDKYDPRKLDFVNPMEEKQIRHVTKGYALEFDHRTAMAICEAPVVEKWMKCKMIGRCLTLWIGFHADDELKSQVDHCQRMWDNFYQFLRLFGEQVLYANILYCLAEENRGEWERNIVPFLTVDQFQIFPNLRKLRVSGIVELDEELENEIDPETLPLAPNLQTLESDFTGRDFPSAILQKYHNQLRSLHLFVRTWKGMNPMDWPNLQELQLHGFNSGEDFADLCAGLALPKLTKLVLDVGNVAGANANFQILLQTLRDFSAVAPLNTLRLVGGLQNLDLVNAGNIAGSCYALTNIKTLEFDHGRDSGSAPMYDFLLHLFPLLENLNIFVRNKPRELSRDHRIFNEVGLLPLIECEGNRRRPKLGKELEIVEVNKYMYSGEMYKSNIWMMLPKLKVFSFQWEIFTRAGYEACNEKLTN